MPYRRATGRRYKKRTYKKKGTYVRKVARQEATRAIAKQVETKIFDGAVNATAIDYSGTTSLFNMTYDPVSAGNISQGVGDQQYIGQRIRPVYLTIRGSLTVGDSNNVVRVILVQDKVSGTALTGATILQSVGNIRAPFSPLEKEYDNTFYVIFDRIMKLDTVNMPTRTFKFRISRKHLRYINFRGASGNIEAGGLYLLFISDSAISTHPSVIMSWRLSFKDA